MFAKILKCIGAILIATIILASIHTFASWLIDPDLKDMAQYGPRLEKLYTNNHPLYLSYFRFLKEIVIERVFETNMRMDIFSRTLIGSLFFFLNLGLPILLTYNAIDVNEKEKP